LIFFAQDLQINASPAKLQIIKRIKKRLFLWLIFLILRNNLIILWLIFLSLRLI
jgi:hypothetical protein